jgi:hypothetical protein
MGCRKRLRQKLGYPPFVVVAADDDYVLAEADTAEEASKLAKNSVSEDYSEVIIYKAIAKAERVVHESHLEVEGVSF